jgi:hypothetical protein
MEKNEYIKEVGKLGPTDKCFDLEVYINYGRLDWFAVRYDNAITGIELSFGGCSTGEFRGSDIDVNEKLERICLMEDEITLSVEVCCNKENIITGLILQTNKNRYSFGNISKEVIKLSSPDCHLVSFKFGFSNNLCYIQPIYSESVYETDTDELKVTNLYGTWYQESEKFINEYQPIYGKLKEINIYSDDYVKGYMLIYENKSIQTCNIFPNNSNKVKVKSLKLNPDEGIEKIYIRVGSVIDHLSFITNKGNIVSGGAIGGSGKIYTTPNRFRFIGFEGGLQNNLHYLKLKFIKD